ncbi:MAG: hypothetical protein AAB784_00970 [Patescibacteria group bacterium]
MDKNVFSSAISASLSIVLVTILTVWAELSPGFKNFLAGMTGHHWISKSLAVIIFFPIILLLIRGLVHRGVSDKQVSGSLWVLIFVTILGYVAVLGFFIWHFL